MRRRIWRAGFSKVLESGEVGAGEGGVVGGEVEAVLGEGEGGFGAWRGCSGLSMRNCSRVVA